MKRETVFVPETNTLYKTVFVPEALYEGFIQLLNIAAAVVEDSSGYKTKQLTKEEKDVITFVKQLVANSGFDWV